jgi:hypothetical protein
MADSGLGQQDDPQHFLIDSRTAMRNGNFRCESHALKAAKLTNGSLLPNPLEVSEEER